MSSDASGADAPSSENFLGPAAHLHVLAVRT